MSLRGLGALARAHLLETLRSRTALFWSVAFPLIWLALAAGVFGRGTPEGARFMLPGVFTITLLGGTFFSVAFRMVSERQAGLLRRYKATPVEPLAVVLAHGTTSLVNLTISFGLQAAGAFLIWHVRPEGSWAALLVVLACGMLAFIPLGLLVGSVARDSRTAPALTHVIFFPLMFLSGAAVPLHLMGDWVRIPARVLPSTYVMECLQGVLVRGETIPQLAGPLAVLLLTFVVGASVNALVFRWESTDPIRGRDLLVAVGALVLLYAGAALLAPDLRSLHAPAAAAAAIR